MSTDASASAGHKPLQFDVDKRITLESPRADTAATSCKTCSRPIISTYYQANNAIICDSCRDALDRPRGTRFTRGLHATALGMLAAIAGSVLYSAVVAITGREFGLVAIAVGFMVGKAVRKGSRGRGGWAYQTLAVALTYLAIVSTYIPLIGKEFQKNASHNSAHPRESLPMADTITISARAPHVGRIFDSSASARTADTGFNIMQSGSPVGTAPATPLRPRQLGAGTMLLGIGSLVLLAAEIPIFAGFSNLIGLLIIGIAAFGAWLLNRRLALTVTGPYRIGGGTSGVGAVG
ncbi:MAG TPA: hypothetical protein VGH98_05100 [Gemmatimonadaceae bacterium]|jgi:hypothetical protein